MGRLEGKVALITGGARGMGAEHVRRFVAEGAKVLFSDVLVKEGKALEAQLGNKAKFIKQDVTSEEEWKMAVSEAENTFGPVNILVNNAGIVINDLIENMSLDTYMKVINVNQVSIFLGMKYVLPSMKKAGSGSIVNISSIAGIKASPATAAYSSSKFAVRALTQTAALEFAPYGIRVNSIHPGLIDTDMIKGDDVKDAVNKIAQSLPLRRVARPEEVTNLLLFLASDESSYCTGSEFVVDGGALIG